MGGRRSGFLGRRAPPAGAGAGAGALLPRSRLRPRTPGHSFLQVWSLALSLLPGHNDPRAVLLPSVRRSVSLRSTVECGLFLPAPCPVAAAGGGKQQGPTEANFLVGAGTFTSVPRELGAGAEVVRKEGESDLLCQPPSELALWTWAMTHLGRHNLDELIQEAELAHFVMEPLATALHACFQNLEGKQ